MAIVQTALNYTRANTSNFSDSVAIPVTSAAEVLLLEWEHTIPVGTQFVEVNSCIGWEGAVGSERVEFRLFQNGSLVATADDSADDVGVNVDVLTHFKSILTAAPNAPGTQTVFQLRAIAILPATTLTVTGPLTLLRFPTEHRKVVRVTGSTLPSWWGVLL